MGDSNFRKNMSRIFSKVVPDDVIARKFKEHACHLCKVEFHDEKTAWKHYYGSYHGDKMKRLPKRRNSSEASKQKAKTEAVRTAADKKKPSEDSRKKPSPKDSRKTPSPNDLRKTVSQSDHQKQLQQQYLQACQQQLLQAPQQPPGQNRPIIILPPNLNLSSLPQNLISSLGPALTQMMPQQQLQSYPMMFPYSQQFQAMPTSTSSPKSLSPTMTTTPCKPQLSPVSHFKNLVQAQQQAEAPRTVRI